MLRGLATIGHLRNLRLLNLIVCKNKGHLIYIFTYLSLFSQNKNIATWKNLK